MAQTPPDKHIGAARQRLGHLAGLAERSEQAERQILSSAQDRLAAVLGDIDRLRARALGDDEVAEHLLGLTQEAGQLRTVIAQSQQVLGG